MASEQQISSATATYPAITKHAAGFADGVPTNVTSVMFADKVMITITQEGRLAQWVASKFLLPLRRKIIILTVLQIDVPLGTSGANLADLNPLTRTGEDDLLPMPHFTPRILLGGSTSERDTLGQLYATQITSAVISRNPHENRAVVVGLGLQKFEANRQAFYDIIDLVMTCL